MNIGAAGSTPVSPQVVSSKAAAAKLAAAATAATARRKKAHAKSGSASLPTTTAVASDPTKSGFSVRV